MVDRDALKAHAERVGAIVTCEAECGFREPFAAYLERDDRVDEVVEEVTFECPSCGHRTLYLGKEGKPRAIAVSGLDELESLAGE